MSQPISFINCTSVLSKVCAGRPGAWFLVLIAINGSHKKIEVVRYQSLILVVSNQWTGLDYTELKFTFYF